jgi:hypothetical protein
MSRDYAIAVCAALIGIFGLLACLLFVFYAWLNHSQVFRAGGDPIELAVLAVLGCLAASALYLGAKRLPR